MILSLLFILILSPLSSVFAQKLNWCGLDRKASYTSLKSALDRSIQSGVNHLNTNYPVLTSLGLAGTLPSDPRQIASLKAVELFPSLIDLAVCARFSKLKSEECKRKLTHVTLSWARSYRPSGNSINEMRFIEFIQAIDLVGDKLSLKERDELHGFIRSLIIAGDKLFSSMKADDKRLVNNWHTWRLAIRAIAGKTLGDQKVIQSTRDKFRVFVLVNLFPDGRTEDYIERDSLLYHVYNLEAYQATLSFVPEALDFFIFKDRYIFALELMKPYYLKEREHIEFQRSTVAFDIQRREAGLSHYQRATWDTNTADPLLSYARIFVPEIKTWSKRSSVKNYSPSMDLYLKTCAQ